MDLSNTNLSERLQRLKFIIDEMQIANHIASNTSNQFLGRTIARHILIRAENFIVHTRQLKKPLNVAGFKTSKLNGDKEVLASDLEETYLELRHKLGAHVQDLDFGRHIEIWQELESDKVGYLLNAALQIYKDLAQLNIPDYTPYAEPNALSNNSIPRTLETLRKESVSDGHVEFAADTLAMTRENATAMINTTPIHQRAGQLALLKRWIEIQNNLLKKLSDDIIVARILKARIITDIVSFCDCLVTRPVSIDQPQFMDGLDNLVRAEGKSFLPVEEFISASKFDDILLSVRDLRNSIGAHLSDDFSIKLSQITNEIDNFDIEFAINYFYKLYAAFQKVCLGILYLKMYALDGERAHGISSGRESVIPYNERQGGAMSYPSLGAPKYNQEEYFKQFDLWLHGDEDSKSNARQYFWNAFIHSPSIEVIEETVSLGSGHRSKRHDYREAHAFVTKVAENSSEQEFTDILILLNSCSRGHPYALAESVIRFGGKVMQSRQRQICCLLGEIQSYPHKSVKTYLSQQTDSQDWLTKLAALVAMYKAHVAFEGLNRSNRIGYPQEYESIAYPLLEKLNPNEKLICELAFASCLSSSSINYAFKFFQKNYETHQNKIRNYCVEITSKKADQSQIDTLDGLIATHDYIGVCAWISLNIEGGKESPLAKALLQSCCLGLITPARHEQSTRHLAICFHLLDHHEEASQIMGEIANTHPNILEYQILAVELLENTSPLAEGLLKKIDLIRRSYQLTHEDEARLQGIEERAKAAPQITQ